MARYKITNRSGRERIIGGRKINDGQSTTVELEEHHAALADKWRPLGVTIIEAGSDNVPAGLPGGRMTDEEREAREGLPPEQLQVSPPLPAEATREAVHEAAQRAPEEEKAKK